MMRQQHTDLHNISGGRLYSPDNTTHKYDYIDTSRPFEEQLDSIAEKKGTSPKTVAFIKDIVGLCAGFLGL